MADCLIALGSNLGDRVANLERAVRLLDAQAGIRRTALSPWYHSSPIGGPAGQPEFVNAVVRLETARSPRELLDALRGVESSLGRERRTRWAARTVDLDLLLYGRETLRSPELRIPHPRMAFRRFVLEPAADVAGELVHPEIGWTIRQLLIHLNQAPDYVAITGPPGCGKTQLAERAAAATGAKLIPDAAGAAGGSNPETRGSPERETRCFRLRRRALQAHAASHGARLCISDFWIGQCLGYAALAGGGQTAAALERELSSEGPPALVPKLLVWLGPRTAAEEAQADRRQPSLGPSLREAVRNWYTGPLLELETADREDNLVELKAAVEAMH